MATLQKVEGRKRISPKVAAQKAAEYYKDVSGSDGTYVSLEEIELSSDGSKWNITMGVRDPNYMGIYSGVIGGDNKQYKAFVIDAYTGEVQAMKIKKI